MSDPSPIRIDGKTKNNQRTATDPAHSAWVTANAGSGKTYVLTRRVLRLLLSGADPGSVLCLTFTKAAAAQMATRVFEELAAWTQCSPTDLAKTLSDLLGRRPDNVESDRARQLFARAIETPGRLKIQTIHAFCESLLQRFAFEASVPSGFTVLDDDTGASLMAQARQDVLTSPGDEEISSALAQLSLLLDPDRFAKMLKTVVNRRYDIRRTSYTHPGTVAATVRQHVSQILGLSDNVSSQDVVDDILNSDVLPRNKWTTVADTLTQYPKRDTNITARELRIAASQPTRDDMVVALSSVFLNTKDEPRKTLLNADAAKQEPELLNLLEREQTRVLPMIEAYRAAKTVEANVDLAIVGDAVLQRFNALKQQRGTLDFADLIAASRALLETSRNAAWVLYKLDPGLDHILVDEAQDTSPDQWAVIRALSEEFLAGDSARKINRTVFAVGDPKQSIYSFQGADPVGFAVMKRYLAGRMAESGHFEEVTLDLSFRSAWAVLEAVDLVFAQSPAMNGLLFDGESGLAHSAARHSAQGQVELWDVIPKPEKQNDGAWLDALDKQRAESPSLLLAAKIADAIRAKIDSGDALPSTGQPARPGDFLILLRTRKALATPIIRALKDRGVDVAGADRLALTGSIAVQDIMALMRTALTPEDDYSLACVLKSPLFDLDDDHLMTLAIDRPSSLWAALHNHSDDAGIKAAADRMRDWLPLIRNGRPFDVLCRILGADGGRKAYRARLGIEADDVLDELMERALAFERDNVQTVSGFLTWLERSGGEVKRETGEDADAVRVMTVHGAKGLEAPVVILADTCTKPDGRKIDSLMIARSDDIFEPPEAVIWWPGKALDTPPVSDLRDRLLDGLLEEYHRLLYVAMTRAEDHLIICGAQTGQSVPDDCWYRLIEQGLERHLSDAGDGIRRFVPEHEGAPGDASAELESKETRTAIQPIPAWASTQLASAPRPVRRAASALATDTGQVSSSTGRQDDSSPSIDPRLRGHLIHLLLEHLPSVPPATRDAASHQLVAHNAPNMHADAANEICTRALGVLNGPETEGLFADGSLGEVPIAGFVRSSDDKTMEISGRIDRLVITDDRITIADFKTGAAPAAADPVPPAYIAQMAAYSALLSAIHPGKTIDAVLVWTDADDGPATTPLSANMLAGYEAVAPMD